MIVGYLTFITTPTQRDDIFRSSFADVERDGRVLTTRVSFEFKRVPATYDPVKDEFCIPSAQVRTDLIGWWAASARVSRLQTGQTLCQRQGLDFERYRAILELMEYVGFDPDRDDRALGGHFERLAKVDQQLVGELLERFGWVPRLVEECKVLVYDRTGAMRLAFPLHDAQGRVMAFRLVDPADGSNAESLGNNNAASIFPPLSHLGGDAEVTVILTTGVVNALTARALGLEAFAITGQASKLTGGQLAPLQGRHVCLAFDERAHSLVRDVADLLRDKAATVSVVSWPDAWAGSPTLTLHSFLRQPGATEEDVLEALAGLATVLDFRTQIPLRRPLADPEPYPVDRLPAILFDAVDAVAGATGCDPALAAQSFLAASALAAQGFINVSIDGRESPVSCYFLTVAESGERKSTVDKLALAPFRDRETQLRTAYREEFRDYENRLAIWKKQVAEALRGPNREEALRSLGAPPVLPLDASLICEEPTFEGLVDKMVHGQPSVGIFCDEGARFTGGYAMAKDNEQKTSAGLSSIWDGQVLTRVRVRAENVTLVGRRVSLHLMVQPIIGSQLFSNQLLIGQGLLSRVLPCAPASTIGTRMYTGVDLSQNEAYRRYVRRISQILSDELPIVDGTANELNPAALTLTGEARALWIDFYNRVEREMLGGGAYACIRGFASKAPEHAARLAGVMTYVDEPGADNIPAEWVDAGIEIIKFHLSEALRLFNSGNCDHELALAELCLEWLRSNYPDAFALAELYQRGPVAVRTRASAARIVKILEDHNLVTRIEGGAFVGNHRRKQAWRVAA